MKQPNFLGRVKSSGKRMVSSLAIYSLGKQIYLHNLRSTDHLCLPDFVCIGAQKAGTAWLYKNLQAHPDIFMSTKKELHYFDRNFYSKLRSYSNWFLLGADKVKGEITPAYSILPKRRISFVKKIMPNLKLILILRNPIDRAWSAVRMGLISNGRNKPRLEEISDSVFLKRVRHRASRKRGDYVTILDNWLSVFPAEQLYIGIFEDIRKCPQKLLCEIFAFLGVSQDVDWGIFPYKRTIHASPGITMPQRYRVVLEEMYCEDIERLCQRLGKRVEPWRCSRDQT